MNWLKSTILILAIFVFSGVAAQNLKDKQGRKQGEWKKTYPKSTALEYKGTFKDDKPIGVFTYYYPSNKVKAVIKHGANSPRSEAYFYHENGELMTYGIYQNMKKDSVWLNFGPSGRISYLETYSKDVLNGEKKVFFISENLNDRSSKISAISMYKNGKLEGEFKEYFDFGQLKTFGKYHDDKPVGIWEKYHPNGKKMSLTRYKDGLRHGWCNAFDETGKEISKLYYYKGKLVEGKDLDLLLKQMKEKGINPNE